MLESKLMLLLLIYIFLKSMQFIATDSTALIGKCHHSHGLVVKLYFAKKIVYTLARNLGFVKEWIILHELVQSSQHLCHSPPQFPIQYIICNCMLMFMPFHQIGKVLLLHGKRQQACSFPNCIPLANLKKLNYGRLSQVWGPDNTYPCSAHPFSAHKTTNSDSINADEMFVYMITKSHD